MSATLPQRRHAPSESQRYIVLVLWVAGWPASAIGALIGLRQKQALGIAQRGPWPNRSAMTDGERAAALVELQAIRCDDAGRPIDGGMLPEAAFQVRPLGAVQRK